MATNEETLEKCSCGNEEFDAPINFKRSDNGLREKLDEVIKILEVSVFLCECLNLNEFYNVIAVQLRILLCENLRLIKSKIQKPLLHPHNGKVFKGTTDFDVILYSDLFDRTKTAIPLDKWLKQEIIRSSHWKAMNVKEIIIAWANKNGGAHVDPVIPEKEFFAIAVSGKDYLLEIAKYVIDMLGYNLKQDILDRVIKPYNELIKK